jgi:hypothetical protein
MEEATMKPFRSVLVRGLFILAFALSLLVASAGRAYADDPVQTDAAAPVPDPVVVDPAPSDPAPSAPGDLPVPLGSPDDPEFD